MPDSDGRLSKSEMEELRNEIVRRADISIYDHRLFLPDIVKQQFPQMLDDEQLYYSRFKKAVAAQLKPRTIYEVGIGWGVSAKAFIAGYPTTQFFGIDNGEMGLDAVQAAGLGVNWTLVPSDNLTSFTHPFGEIDLIHIDGGHGHAQKSRDIVKAFQARPEWILVDDFHDVMVAAGTMDGIWKAAQNSLHMLYFENSHTGSLLIHAARLPAENRSDWK